jgi:hypothetical protein
MARAEDSTSKETRTRGKDRTSGGGVDLTHTRVNPAAFHRKDESMTSTQWNKKSRLPQENKKRRLPMVLSILFGSSLVTLAMATVSGRAQAQGCSTCQMCKWSSVGMYCSSSSPGSECCYSEWNGPSGHNICFTYGTWCS